jgi:phosphohistidine phosphatase
MNFMKLIVMRHGEAEAQKTSDKTRNLTEYGIQQAKNAGQWLRSIFPECARLDAALVSPFNRAQQTFTALANEVDVTIVLTAAELTPNAKIQKVQKLLFNFCNSKPNVHSLLLVSHMPLVSYLLDDILPTNQANLFATSSMAIIDYDIGLGTGRLLKFYHPSNEQQITK